MSDADTRQAYDAWHARLDVDAMVDTPWHELVRAHLDLERDLANRRVLEIACGRGGFACWLATRTPPPARLVAADFSPTAVAMGAAYAREHGITSVEWEVGDMTALAHPEASFDTVISCETIEHVPDPRGAAGELYRVVAPGGRLILTTPNYVGVTGLYRAYLRVIGRPYTEEGQPINHMTMLPRTLRWLRRAGFSVREVDGVGHYWLFPGRVPKRLPALDRARPLTRWTALHSLVVAERR